MIRQTFFLACAVCAFSSPAWAQFDGLDLSDTAPAPTPAPAPAKKGDKKRGAEPKEAKKPEAAVPAPAPAPAASLELDLSTTADVKMVLLTPPIVKVTSSTGGFAGFDTKKTSEKFDPAGHKKAVAAFEKPLDGKVLSADVAWAALTRENVTAATVDKPASIQKLARSTKAGFVVVLDGTKSGALAATIYDPNGRTQGKPLSAKNADELAPLVAKELIELSKKTAAPVAEAPKDEPTVAPPPVEDEVSEPVTEFASVEKKSMFDERRTKPRIGVAVGPGGVTRSLSVSGEAAETLAELRNGGTPGIGVYAHINPLQFIAATEGKKWSDLELEVHWRRSFTAATGVSGGVEGQSCSMTDDDLQLRGTYRYRLTDGTYAPSVGLGGGFSQERTVFACDLPVISTVYRGIDAQLRVRQPVFKDVLSLDVAVGPRFLFAGPSANPGFTVAGEAWLEAKPISFLFARGGGRLSRIQASDNAGLAVVDTRMFFGVEVGAFF